MLNEFDTALILRETLQILLFLKNVSIRRFPLPSFVSLLGPSPNPFFIFAPPLRLKYVKLSLPPPPPPAATSDIPSILSHFWHFFIPPLLFLSAKFFSPCPAASGRNILRNSLHLPYLSKENKIKFGRELIFLFFSCVQKEVCSARACI